MGMLHIFKELVKEYGYEPSIYIKKEAGVCEYCPRTDTIILRLGNRRYDEQVFALLHEYRHCIQRNTLMFPKMLSLTQADLPNDARYLDLPWEKDANEWAIQKGIEMGFFLPGYLPRLLQNPELLKGWKEYSKVS